MSKLSNINKRRKDFIYEVFILFLSIKGRINFLQLGRYGLSGEQRHRQQFEKPFDFLAFNKELIVSNGSGRYVMRDDADLLYQYTGSPTGQKGRSKKYAGKIDIGNIDKDYFTLEGQTDEHTLYSGIVYSKSLKRNIRIAYVLYNIGKGKQTIKLYYSTDLSLCPEDILLFYQSRFQIEFLYRDGKQFTGLCDVQARGENKLNFHFNASLTVINIAKVENWLSIPKDERKVFSMSDIKTLNHNRLFLYRFFDVFGIDPNKHKNIEYIKELIYYGTIAA